jgi:hypothetical protein
MGFIDRLLHPRPPAPVRPAPAAPPPAPSGPSRYDSAFAPAVDYKRLGGQPAGNPAATDVNDAFPGLNLSPQSSDADLRTMVSQDIKTAYGRDATQADFDYWLPKLKSDNDSSYVTSGKMSSMDYWHNRLLGWQAGGPDTATQGPYAGMNFGSGSGGSSGLSLFGVADVDEALVKEIQRQREADRLTER